MKMFLAELGIIYATGNTSRRLCVILVLCVLRKGGSKLKEAQRGATGSAQGIENLL